MSRVGTTYLDLGKYTDGENPGSGPQDGTLSQGLNGDKNKIDAAVGPGHNTDGSHKAAVIDAANLKSTVPDGTTIEQDTSTKKLRVKDLGISTAKLADDSVTGDKIDATVAGPGLKQNANGSLSPDVDGTTLTLNGSSKIALVSSGLIRHRGYFHFSMKSGNGRAIFNEYEPSGLSSDPVGLSMPGPGAVVGYTVTNSTGGVTVLSTPYAASGTTHFAQGALLTAIDIGTDTAPCVGGQAISALNSSSAGAVRLGVIVVEFD